MAAADRAVSPGGPLVSIVIPLYNYAHYIEGCIASAVAQTWRPLEVVVINDGSTDTSLEVARRLESDVVRIIDQPNQGTVGAVNRGIAEARGEYVCWLSADDLFRPDKVEKQMRVMREDPGLSCVFSNLTWRADTVGALQWCPVPREEAEEALRREGHVEWDTTYKEADCEGLLGRLVTTTILIYLGTSLIPRRIFDEMGVMDAAYRRSHDYEYAMRLAAAGHRFRLVEDALVICRAHADNTKYWNEIPDDENRVRRKFLAQCTLEQFYPKLDDPRCPEEERARILAEHVRWLIHHRMLDEAREAYDSHVRAGPPGPWSMELGKAWMGVKQPDRGRLELEKALQLDPSQMMAHYLHGDACRAEGRLLDAVSSYARGVGRALKGKRH